MFETTFDVVSEQADSHGVGAALRDDEVGESF